MRRGAVVRGGRVGQKRTRRGKDAPRTAHTGLTSDAPAEPVSFFVHRWASGTRCAARQARHPAQDSTGAGTYHDVLELVRLGAVLLPDEQELWKLQVWELAQAVIAF